MKNFGFHRKLKDIVVIKPSSMTQEQAAQVARIIKRPIIYIEDFKGITGYQKQEIQVILDSLSPQPISTST